MSVSSIVEVQPFQALDQLSKLSSELLYVEEEEERLKNLPSVSVDSGEPAANVVTTVIVTPTVRAAEVRRVQKRKSSPTLPSDDVRWSYADDYFNALNSGDKETIIRVMREIAIPGVVLVSKFTEPGTSNFMPNHVEVSYASYLSALSQRCIQIVGIEAIASTCADFIAAAPDVVMQVVSQEIESYANGESCITMKYSLKGTKILELNGFEEGGVDRVVVTNAIRELGNRLSGASLNATVTATATDPETGKVTETQSTEKFGVGDVNDSAKHISLLATNTFHLNINKKIFLIVSVK